MIPLGHTAALVQSLAEMRVTVYAASLYFLFSTQSRGCSRVHARISQITCENVKVEKFGLLKSHKLMKIKTLTDLLNCKTVNVVTKLQILYFVAEKGFVHYLCCS